jgi:hypothetical protein
MVPRERTAVVLEVMTNSQWALGGGCWTPCVSVLPDWHFLTWRLAHILFNSRLASLEGISADEFGLCGSRDETLHESERLF